MKLVCIGDVLLHPEWMEEGSKEFKRYKDKKFFWFGPDNHDDMRVYIKKMETTGSRCEPVPEEIMEELKDADVIMTHQCPMPSEVFDEAHNLKLLITNRGGIENIDLSAATRAGIPVIANPAHNANAVAEMTVGLMIAETRNIGRCHASMAEHHKWLENFPNFGRIHELKGSTVGLVGFGTIGRIVAEKLSSFGVKLLVYDPYTEDADILALKGRPVGLEELLQDSDIVSLHARVSETSKGMIGEEQFRMMKPTAVLINTARSPLVDMDALYRALKDRRITGAAIDNYDVEPVSEDSPLLALDNITFSCHKSGDTVEAFANSPAMVFEEAEKFFQGIRPRFLMNPETLTGRWEQ